MDFHPFDADYVNELRAGDLGVEEHFVRYFTSLLQLKLRARLQSPQAIEDVRQETLTRVFAALRKEGALRNPERLGAFVNSVCNNVLLEHYRSSSRNNPLDEIEESKLVANGPAPDDEILSHQMKAHVGRILRQISPRDRALLNAVFLQERDREEVCREFGVDADYLRVLLFRAKQSFKSEFLKQIPTGFSAVGR